MMTDRFATFSKNLRNERLSKGLTQAKMAEMLGVSQPVYSRYEKGGSAQGREPDFDSLCTIAEFFGASVNYLLGLED